MTSVVESVLRQCVCEGSLLEVPLPPRCVCSGQMMMMVMVMMAAANDVSISNSGRRRQTEGLRLHGFLGLSLNDRTIVFLVILVDKTVSVE